MKIREYLFALFVTLAFCALILAANLSETNKLSSAKINALNRQINALENESAILADYKTQIDTLTAEIAELRKQLDNKQDKADRSGERMVKRTMHVTAYWAGSCDKPPGHPLYGITASGEKVREWHTVAGGPELPLGTRIYIPFFAEMPNGGWFQVADRGGAIGNGDIDVYMRTVVEALRFGTKDLEVWII